MKSSLLKNFCFLLFLFSAGTVYGTNTSSVLPKSTVQESKSAKIDSVVGWLGFSAMNFRQGGVAYQFPFSPFHLQAKVIVFCGDNSGCDAWRKVKNGTIFTAVGDGIKEEVVFQGVSREKYGCEENQTDMALFSGSFYFPEGPVWVFPKEQSSFIREIAINQLSLLPKSHALAWSLGAYRFSLIQKGAYQASFEIYKDQKTIYRTSFKKYFMKGTPKKPLQDIYYMDLKSFQSEFGLAYPLRAFQIGPDQIVLVLWSPRYEGNAFPLLLLDKGKVVSLGENYLYHCAY